MLDRSLSNENDLISLPNELIRIIWGNEINQSIFDRWSQAFEFSDHERSALIQFEGGPCSVLTPVQAHLLNHLIFSDRYPKNWRQAFKEEIDLHFLNALISILHLLVRSNESYYLATFPFEKQNQKNLSFDEFHRELRFTCCHSKVQLKEQIYSRLLMWKNSYGVLLFLYSCLMTKSVDRLKKEIDDETSLSLIDIEYGHGSQSLTNLLITGYATPHCFDGEKDISGLQLIGIQQQAQIGFLSTLEVYHLLEVGWFLKNPRYPIWILGSETHLTVLFSIEKYLVESNIQTDLNRALRIFNKYDTEHNGFISINILDQVIQELINLSLIKPILLTEDLKRQLDPDQLQIFTKSAFVEYFFPEENKKILNQQRENQNSFQIYHYNGLLRSNKDQQIRYIQGQAFIDDYQYSNSMSNNQNLNDSRGVYLPITSVLRTKWPTIDLIWENQMKPSLN